MLIEPGLGMNLGKKSEKKPHHSCVIQLPPRAFIRLGIYSYVQFVRKCKGQWGSLCDPAVTWGHSDGREPSGWREWVKVLLVKVTPRIRKEGRNWKGSMEPGHEKRGSGESREVLGKWETEVTSYRSSRKERKPGDATARDAAMCRCLF